MSRPTTKAELFALVKQEIRNHGTHCDLTHLDTSLIEDMSNIFYETDFNGNISKWNTSNVKNMECMFTSSSFSGDISNWDVSRVENMNLMFYNSHFNGDVSKWNAYSVREMRSIFQNSPFNGDISQWKPHHLRRCELKNMPPTSLTELEVWLMSNGDGLRNAFQDSPFSGDLRPWGLSDTAIDMAFGHSRQQYLDRRQHIEEKEALIAEFNPVTTHKTSRFL